MNNNPHSIANRVRMTRTARPGVTALLVEGFKDVRVYRNFIDSTKCDPVPAGDRSTALAALRILKSTNVHGVVVILDADTDHAEGSLPTDADVLTPETPDLEGLLIRSPALQKLLVEHDKDPGVTDSVRSCVRVSATLIGRLRVWSKRNRHNLIFKGLDFSAFVRQSPLSIDEGELAAAILLNNPNCTIDQTALLATIRSATPQDSWDFCVGHDMTSILAEYLSKPNAKTPNYSIERQLRLAFEHSHFLQTDLYRKLRTWEENNKPFRVLL